MKKKNRLVHYEHSMYTDSEDIVLLVLILLDTFLYGIHHLVIYDPRLVCRLL